MCKSLKELTAPGGRRAVLPRGLGGAREVLPRWLNQEENPNGEQVSPWAEHPQRGTRESGQGAARVGAQRAREVSLRGVTE